VSADPGVQRRGVAASLWFCAASCKPKWQVHGDQRVADQVRWRAAATSSSVKNEDEEKGSLAAAARFLGIVPIAKHSVSNALKFFLG